MTGSDLDRACARAASKRSHPDGKDYLQLPVTEVQRIAEDVGLEGVEVERAALKQGIIPERYERNFRSFLMEDQIRLLDSRVAVIGLGGLGGTVTEILSRIGVGYLRLVDGDRFEGHNLNRQLLSDMEHLGTPKTEAAEKRVTAVNPSVRVDTVEAFLDAANAGSLVKDVHVAIDCLDSIGSRFDLENACRRWGIPLVSSAIAGTSGHVTTVFPGDIGLQAIFGDSQTSGDKGAETTLGTLPMAVMTAASLECNEAVNILLKREPILRNRMLIFDLAAGVFDTVTLSSPEDLSV